MPSNPNYIQNHPPLRPTPFIELPLRAIEPLGWLRDQLEIQAEGLTGHLGEFWEDVGPNSGWLGGSGESWERGPYYLDGLLPLAYLLKDVFLIAKTQPWIKWTLASQGENGQFGPRVNEDWWSRMIMLKVLIQYAEVTGDERVVPFLTNYFRFQMTEFKNRPLMGWGQARGGRIFCVSSGCTIAQVRLFCWNWQTWFTGKHLIGRTSLPISHSGGHSTSMIFEHMW